VDEQHKFGVRQRTSIRSKGYAPHYLVMTATPIPRTLAMTVFGDLDVSVIDELPPGRSPITTRIVTPERAERAWAFVRSRLSEGEQAYIVYPLVEESGRAQLRAATAEYERLRRDVLPEYRIGLLHGRMRPADKERIMSAFASGELRALVTTTVVEVGIDVPQATLMIIQHAGRFGLAQLHQLRGRVGRGSRPGYCLLFTDSLTGVAGERLAVLARTTDGFRIAEEDLRLRGPGEVVGTRQHGLPALRVADLLRDQALLEWAQEDAAEIIRVDPTLSRPEHAHLRQALLQQFGDRIPLIDVG